MKIYEVKKFTKGIKNRNDIVRGCTLDCEEPESVEKFTDENRAYNKLATMPKSNAYRTRSFSGIAFYYVTEYAIKIYEADEDGEFLEGSDFELNGEIEIND